MNSSPYKFNRNIDMEWFDSIFEKNKGMQLQCKWIFIYLIKRKEG
jgi:hypothetical protein